MNTIINKVEELEVNQNVLDTIKYVANKEFAKEAGTILLMQYSNGAEIVQDLGTGSGRGCFAQGGDTLYGDIVDLAERGSYLVLDEKDIDNNDVYISLDTGEVEPRGSEYADKSQIKTTIIWK